MGNSCNCQTNDKINEFLSYEFSDKPVQNTLIGWSQKEETFVTLNLKLHNYNFSKESPRQETYQSDYTKKYPRVNLYDNDTNKPFSKLHSQDKDFSTQLSKILPHDRSKSIISDSKKSKTQDSLQISLFRSVQDYSKEEDDLESIIFEGEILKYRPGISQEYTPRWCRLTYQGFAYYKNQWSATCSNKNPLVFIPTIQIKQVNSFDRPGKKQEKLFEFEIYLYDEDELTKMSRNTNGFTLKHTLDDQVPSSWWSVRQIEWYSAERRLLFAHKSSKVIQQWIEKINKAIETFNT
jgi:PH domain